MEKAKRQKPKRLVPHPRYGVEIVPSGYNISEAEIRESHWRYKSETIYAETAIPANISRQNYSVFPRRYYVDILRPCSTCSRPFIFFAREQQYWYETLGFYIDADCVNCPECRRSDQELRRRFRRYSEMVGRSNFSDGDLNALVQDAVFLFRAGLIHDQQKIRRLRSLAHRQIPGSMACSVLDEVIRNFRDDEVSDT